MWDFWKLSTNWQGGGRNIGWAEMVAIKLGLLFAVHQGFSDVHFVIKSDNQGVVYAIQGRKSRSPEQNVVLQWITTLLLRYKIWISSTYVPSLQNLADPPSRGLPLPTHSRAVYTFDLPDTLSPFLVRPPIMT
jgi:hypothetical protein